MTIKRIVKRRILGVLANFDFWLGAYLLREFELKDILATILVLTIVVFLVYVWGEILDSK